MDTASKNLDKKDLNNSLENTFKNSNSTEKDAPKTDSTNQTKYNSTFISTAPFKASKCDEILMFPGKRIFPEYDWGTKIDAFFTMSSLLLNTFEKRDNSYLIKSIRLINVKDTPSILPGSKYCLLFEDKILNMNSTVCIEDDKERENIMNSFHTFKSCIKPKTDFSQKQKKNEIEQINEFLNNLCDSNQVKIDVPKLRKDVIDELLKHRV